MLVFPSVFCKHLPVVKITPKLVPRYDHRYDRYSMGPPGLIRDTIANHHAPGEVTTAFWWTHPPKSLRLMDVHSQTIFKEWLYHIVQINMDVQITISYCSSSLSEHLIVIWLMVSSPLKNDVAWVNVSWGMIKFIPKCFWNFIYVPKHQAVMVLSFHKWGYNWLI